MHNLKINLYPTSGSNHDAIMVEMFNAFLNKLLRICCNDRDTTRAFVGGGQLIAYVWNSAHMANTDIYCYPPALPHASIVTIYSKCYNHRYPLPPASSQNLQQILQCFFTCCLFGWILPRSCWGRGRKGLDRRQSVPPPETLASSWRICRLPAAAASRTSLRQGEKCPWADRSTPVDYENIEFVEHRFFKLQRGMCPWADR